MKSKKLKVKNENMDLIYGLIIGDGCLYKHKNGNAFLDIAHCEAQKDYIQYKANILKEISGICCEVKYKKPTKNSNYAKYRFITPSDVFWTKLLSELYSFRNTDSKKKKRITINILKKFSLRTLCLWFMDDGYNNLEKNYVQLSIHQFNDDEAILIKNWIYELTKCDFHIYHKKFQPYLVTYKDAERFRKIMKDALPNIPECMKYKFIQYNNL